MTPSIPNTRSRCSEFSSRVTIYESTSTSYTSSAQASTSKLTSTTPNAKASTFKRIRASPEIEDDVETEESKPTIIKKSSSPRKPKPFINSLAKAHPAPLRWREVWDILVEQRKRIIAPVDEMGCIQGGRERGEAAENEKDNRLSILVSLMLSSQTKDPVTHQATMNLRKMLAGGLTVDSLLASTPEQINGCINKVGFHNIKTKNLALLAARLKADHNGEVPEDLPSLLALNGVGPKMAILFLQGIGKNVGIGVDVHVHRITNLLGWHKPATSTPEQTRLNLESWLPKELHPEINVLLVGFGQEICRSGSSAMRCDMCDLAKVPRLCPSKQNISPKKIAARSPDKKKLKLDLDLDLDAEPMIGVGIEGDAVLGVKEDTEVEEDVKPRAQLLW